ncbi:MAG: SDR family NAD(P)-dependent oxidoreductase [Sneathiellales bacterium]|nr:SDR family NAD(P)-dependent oxidoreductase [Sneathiellales bacterium]
MDLDKIGSKTVAITGGGDGIGAALAVHYSQLGYHVSISGRTEEKLKSVCKSCELNKGSVSYAVVDVTDIAQLSNWLHTLDRTADLTLVIANAGVTNGLQETERLEELKDIHQLLSINLLGAINTLHIASTLFLAKGEGQMAAISSLASFFGFAGSPSYCASKAGLRIYCESLKRNLAGTSVSLTTIFPGYVDTNMAEKVDASKPFQLERGKAAAIIASAISKKKSEWGFPYLLWLGVRLMSLLPNSIKHRIANFFDYHVKPQ